MNSRFPASLLVSPPSGILKRTLGALAPNQVETSRGRVSIVSAIDSRRILSKPMLALVCSERCPGDLIVTASDVATKLRDAAVPVISGFHSPTERECLRILLKGTHPIVASPPRSVEGMRLPAEWRDPMQEGRLLLISPFAAKQNRITAAPAAQRNQF